MWPQTCARLAIPAEIIATAVTSTNAARSKTMEMMTSGEVPAREVAGAVVLEVVLEVVVGEVEQNPNLNPNHNPSPSPNPNPSLTPSLQQSPLAVESGAVEEEENGIAVNHHPNPQPLPNPLPQPHLPSRALASVTFSLINLVPIASRVQEPAQMRFVLGSVAKWRNVCVMHTTPLYANHVLQKKVDPVLMLIVHMPAALATFQKATVSRPSMESLSAAWTIRQSRWTLLEVFQATWALLFSFWWWAPLLQRLHTHHADPQEI